MSIYSNSDIQAFLELLRAGLWEKEARLSQYKDIDPGLSPHSPIGKEHVPPPIYYGIYVLHDPRIDYIMMA